MKPEKREGGAGEIGDGAVAPMRAGIASPVTAWQHRDWWLALAVVGALFAAYAPVWQAGFIWDDDAHLTANPCIIGPLGLKEIWTTAAANYFPLVLTNFWVQHAWWGLNPLPYHLVNVLWHAASAVLLWRVLRRLRVRWAWFGAMLWALHPVQVESVAWISELKNTQSGVFFLLAVWFFERWVDAGDQPPRADANYALALLGAVLAILSKPSTVMLPVVLGLCWWWLKGRWRWRDALWLAPFFLISGAAGGWTIWEQKIHSMAHGPDWDQTVAERFVLAGRVVWFYLGKLVWPHPLVFIYPRWQLEASRLIAWVPLGGAIVAFAALGRVRRGWGPPLYFTAAFFLVSLFPVLGFFDVFFFRYSFVADHFQYLASIGPLALAGATIALLVDAAHFRTKAVRWLGPALLLGIFGGLTGKQCTVYRDEEKLWNSSLALNSESWIAQVNLGFQLASTGRAGLAIPHYREALRLRPGSAEVQTNLGSALVQLGRYAEAIAVLEVAVAIKPDLADAHNNLGLALVMAGRDAEALPAYETALRLRPDFASAQFNLGNWLARHNRWAEAGALYQQVLRVKPDDPEIQYKLGNALLHASHAAEAIPHLEAALRVKPDHIDARTDLAGAYYQLGRIPEALSHYAELARLQPGNPEAHNNFAAALMRSGRAEEALVHYEQALQLRPNFVTVRSNLAGLLRQLGRPAEAIKQYEEILRLKPDDLEARNSLRQLGASSAVKLPPK